VFFVWWEVRDSNPGSLPTTDLQEEKTLINKGLLPFVTKITPLFTQVIGQK